MLTWEFSVLDFIQAHLRSGIGDIVMPLITHLGDSGVIWVVLALVLLIYPKTRKTGAALAVSLALEVICCNLILKPFVARSTAADSPPRRFFLPLRAYGSLLRGGVRSVFQREQAAVPGPDFGGADRIFPVVSLCPLSHRCAGRGGAGGAPRLGGLHPDSSRGEEVLSP